MIDIAQLGRHVTAGEPAEHVTAADEPLQRSRWPVLLLGFFARRTQWHQFGAITDQLRQQWGGNHITGVHHRGRPSHSPSPIPRRADRGVQTSGGISNSSLVGDDVNDHAADQCGTGRIGTPRRPALAGDTVCPSEHRGHRLRATLPNRARILSTHRPRNRGEFAFDQFGMRRIQPTPHRSGPGVIIRFGELDIHPPLGLLEPLLGLRIVLFDQRVDGLLNLRLRQQSPPRSSQRDTGVDGRHRIGVNHQMGAPRDRRDQPRLDPSRHERRVDLRQPFPQRLGQIHLRGRPTRAQVQRRSHLSGGGVPAITRPQPPRIIRVVYGAATPFDQLGDRRQPPSRTGSLGTRPTLDRAHYGAVIGLRQVGGR